MLRCKDNSIYTGYTDNIEKRMKAHFLKQKQGAKYTKSHDPLKLEAVWRCKEKGIACKLEYHIKRLSKTEKEKLILGAKLKDLLKEKIDSRKYYRIKINDV